MTIPADRFFERPQNVGEILGVDDVHHANLIMDALRGMEPEMRMYRLAEFIAKLRAHYVEAGRLIERNAIT